MSLNHTDSYKLSHKGFMNEGTEVIYSNLTPRSTKHLPVIKELYDNRVVFFGLQHFVKDYLQDHWNQNFFWAPKKRVIPKFKRLLDAYLGPDAVSMEHFEALHDLGHLPIQIKAVKEGSAVDVGVPVLTIVNTHKDFAWLTNYLETIISCELWKPMTTATIIREYRKMGNAYAMKTTGSVAGTEFQFHGFEFRGMSGRHDAAINAAAFLLSSCGTDTVPALDLIEESYNTDITKEFIATSVPATEHSIASLGTSLDGELESFRRWITESYPSGIVSIVSDTYDYWKVLTEYLPLLKADILARPLNALGLSKVVVRPDSGDPVKIICGLDVCNYEQALKDWFEEDENPEFCYDVLEDDGKFYRFDCEYDQYPDGYTTDKKIILGDEVPEHVVKGSIEVLWDLFGGTVTEQGYKLLDSHIGLIYGDSITLDRAQKIFAALEAKGFASTNVVFGVGSYTMNYLTRDSLGIAIKATYAEVNGEGVELYKDPITDDGTKKSLKGLLRVEQESGQFVVYDQQTKAQEESGELELVFQNGSLFRDQKFSEIRDLLWS